MSSQPAGADLYQLTVRGAPIPDSLEKARSLHNQTAGANASVAAARKLGDLSHNVYTPLDSDGTLELLFLDTWNSVEGLAEFFADPGVIEAAGQLFEDREGIVWMPAEGFGSFSLLTPSSRPPVALGLLRATLDLVEAGRAAFAAQTARTINAARVHGLISHQVFMRMPAVPGEQAPPEVLGLDHWNDVEGMNRFYADLENYREFDGAFTGPPQTSAWRPAPGDWREW
jgi:hypothetical protein